MHSTWFSSTFLSFLKFPQIKEGQTNFLGGGGGDQCCRTAELFGSPPVHSTSWKCSTWWKFGPYIVYIFIVDWNFVSKFCRSNPSFNGNILVSLYLKSETSAHAQLCDYLFIHTIYKFHGIVLAGNSH